MINQHLKREMTEEEFSKRQKIIDEIEGHTGIRDDGLCNLETLSLTRLLVFIRATVSVCKESPR